VLTDPTVATDEVELAVLAPSIADVIHESS
jgi:hypothetical protein